MSESTTLQPIVKDGYTHAPPDPRFCRACGSTLSHPQNGADRLCPECLDVAAREGPAALMRQE